MWFPKSRKRYDAVVTDEGLTAGEFLPIRSSRRNEKQKVVPRLTIRNTGACSINNGFFKETGIDPNSPMEFQADEHMSMVRFRFNHPTPLHPIELNLGNFTVNKEEARTILHYANQTVGCFVLNAKVEFVIVRQDKLGWWYAKASGYRYEMPEPRTWEHFTSAQKALWNLPHEHIQRERNIAKPPTPPMPPLTRIIVNGKNINKK